MLPAALKWLDMGFAVFPLQPRGKEPLIGSRGFKDATRDAGKVRKWWSREPDMNIGLALGSASGGVFAFDFDIKDDADGLDALNEFELASPLPDTLTLRTGSGGVHILYRSPKHIAPSVNPELAIDVRGDGSYIVAPPSIHPNGNAYTVEIDRDIADADANVYTFLEHVQPKRDWSARFELPKKVKAHDGRNDTLFRMACSLHAQEMEPAAILHALFSYNDECCEPPLGKAEVRKIFNSVMSYEPGTQHDGEEPKPKLGKPTAKAKFEHNKVARCLIDERGACFVNGMPAVRSGMAYRAGWEHVDGAVIDMHDDASAHNQREVRHYLMVRAPRVEQSRPELIAFTNGVLDIETMELREPLESDVIPNVIPHRWNPDAESEIVTRTLRKMAAGDDGTLENLGEVIGLCMFRSSRYGICPVLLGAGSNGKSTYIDMIHAVIGNENMSALQPREIGQRFQAAQLIGKLANLGDDISNDYIDADSCATIKKVATGSTIYTDVKGGDGFNFQPYCTMVFSANEFPRLGDSSYGMRRRLFPIAFKATFDRSDPDFDARIGEKLASEDACEYLCKIGVYSMLNVIRNSGMTENAESRRIIDRIAVDNSSVLQWMEDMGLTAEYAVGMTVQEVYSDYQEWCKRNGVNWIGSRKFSNVLGGTWRVKATRNDHATLKGRRVTVRRYEIQG